MKLYNTLTRKIEDITPLNPPEVTVYTCGPTVYDYTHIGHWFNYVRMDTLIRALTLAQLKPKWVMNITDVGHLVSDADEGEDKLEKGARREGKSAWEVAEFYTKDFLDGMKLLNMLEPGYLVKATDHIDEQIKLIQRLEHKGFTYTIDDGVYYDTSKFPTYGEFAKLDIDEQWAGARIAVNPQKRNLSDFALWKFSPTDHQRDMEWDSPWGKGFPGWHIECSAMSMKYLGETLDLHTGGIDHIPVHHTNEIAQSEAATGKRFANMWLHSNHVMVNGEKISKSLGNGIRLQDVTDRGISPMAIRLHVLESHYRTQSTFSWDSLVAAQNRLRDIYAWADLRYQTTVDVMPEALDQLFGDTRKAMLEAITNDLNTPLALAELSKLITYMQNIPIPGVEGQHTSGTLKFMSDLLGLELDNRPDITDEQKQLIAEREAARQSKDFARSDELRDSLEKQGLGLRDTQNGVIWYRL